MHIKKWVVTTVTILLIVMTVSQVTWAIKKPPKNKVILEKKFEKIKDNSWSNLELDDPIQPGVYYIEMSDVLGKWGCWGAKVDPYKDGTAWQNEEELPKCDLRLKYRVKGDWVELIEIKQLGVINDNWFPFANHAGMKVEDAKGNPVPLVSIGQSFIALEKFDGVGLQTPTWHTNDSSGLLTLYAEVLDVSALSKLATTWGNLKREF
ncbi:MAG: hypothetical protein VX677_05955 [Candidatus Poribacteria bacterium]|nr:hypothetical protein [Candidatus Poribacteria bacterium]